MKVFAARLRRDYNSVDGNLTIETAEIAPETVNGVESAEDTGCIFH